jgi:adenine-specific DNA-methyltransferase
MAKYFNEKIIELLKTDSRFVDDEGELVKAAVIDRAWKIDRELVKLLLGESEIKRKFFDEIEGHSIFNINTFIEYIADKNFLANSYTRFRNKIGLNIDGKFLRERGEVSLVWPYKDCVLEGGQTKEEEKRKEIFFNEILAQDEIDQLFDPKVLTNWKRYTVEGEQKITEIKRDETGMIRENLIIKGNNLLALHTLKKQFQGKVKLIYIDPPFNINADTFGYNDSFKHSSWLTFMKNRLEVAKDCMRPDGTLFIHIDDSELGYLITLVDEVFGRENRLSIVTFKQGSATGHKAINPGCVTTTNFILIYAKFRELWKPNRIFTRRERNKRYNKFILDRELTHDKWQFTTLARAFAESQNVSATEAKKRIPDYEAKLMDFVLEHADSVVQLARPDYSGVGGAAKKAIDKSKIEPKKVVYLPRSGHPDMYFLKGERILFYSDTLKKIDGERITGEPLTSLWDDIPSHNLHNEGGVKLKRGKKPEGLLRRILAMCSTEGDLVLDFFSGSGTTAAVAHKMGRKYIGIEQLDYCENDTVARLCNVIHGDPSGISGTIGWKGGGEFIYCELKKYNENFMYKIQKSKSFEELVELWKDIAENSFLNWYVNPEMPKDAVNDFIEIGKSENGQDKQKKLLVELLNKNQLYVNLSEIDDADFQVGEEDKKMNQAFYGENA